MDDPSVDEHLFGDPSSSVLSDRLLSDQETLTESRSYTRLMDADLRARLQPGRSGASRTMSNGSNGNTCASEWDVRNLEYVSEVDENLMCPICHSPFVAPVSLKCQHIFCRHCLFEALNHQQDNKTCPSCRQSFNPDSIIVVPKVVHRILDELKVKCPLSSRGCPDIIHRGSVQTHLDRYCGYEEVPCSSDDCEYTVSRRLAEGDCLHVVVECLDCSEEMFMLDLEDHQTIHCKVSTTYCSACNSSISKALYKYHQETCPDKIIPCAASEYGCDFVDKRQVTTDHITNCPLAKLTPIINIQNARLEEHAKALKYLQRKVAIHDGFLDSVKDTLAALPTPEMSLTGLNADSTASVNAPFDSPSSHLLSLHETLREEVARVSAAVSDLDAKTDTAFLNTSLRAKEEAAHRDAVIAQLRVQVQWLVSSRLQGMHSFRSTGGVLGTGPGIRRDTDEEDPGIGTSRLPPLTRRGSDGLGTGGREKL